MAKPGALAKYISAARRADHAVPKVSRQKQANVPNVAHAPARAYAPASAPADASTYAFEIQSAPSTELVAQAEPETAQEMRRKGRPNVPESRNEHLNFYVTRRERKLLETYARRFHYRTLSDALREIFTAGVQVVPTHCKP